MKLQSKFAIVTGSSTGIGRAIALELAKEGSFIALAGRTQAGNQQITKIRRYEDA